MCAAMPAGNKNHGTATKSIITPRTRPPPNSLEGVAVLVVVALRCYWDRGSAKRASNSRGGF